MYPIFDAMMVFVFCYPLYMAWIWMIGGIYYRFHWEGEGGPDFRNPPPLKDYPFVSLLVPCHNEGAQVRETVESLLNQDWPDFEVIAINDCSTDDTGAQLDEMLKEHPRLRVIHQEQNQGKGAALRVGALVARGEHLVCIDGDALLDPNATHWMMRHFIQGPRVGAVTGNPRIRNRTTLLGKIQVGEFSSIIGLMKRAQRIYGRVFTTSGVVSAFRRTALHRIGYWNTDMATEDIDISWRLQLHHWDIRYEPRALCWILMPETIKGIWNQRLRWAQGGAEVAMRHFRLLLSWRARRMWMVLLEYSLSIVWSYFCLTMMLVWGISNLLQAPVPGVGVFPKWHGVVLGTTCMMQFFVSMLIDRRYEPRMYRHFFWIVWYPLVYWSLNMLTTVFGAPRALRQRSGKHATWVSPDRGIG